MCALGLFAAFRLAELTRYALWYDELFSLTLAQMSWGDLLRAAVADRTNPPLFYALLKLWIGVGGNTTSVAWMRLLPCLTGIVAAVPLAALARNVFEPLDATSRGALPASSPARSPATSHEASLSGWLTALPAPPSRPLVAAVVTLAAAAASPLLVFLANELRGYSLILLLSTTSLLAFERVAEAAGWLEPGASDGDVPSWRGQAASEYRRRAVLLAVVNTLLVYTHYFGWLLVAAEVGAAWWWQRRTFKAVLTGSLASAALFAPWALAVASGAAGAARPLANVDWIARPTFGALPGFYDALVARVLTPELAWIGVVVVLVPLALLALGAAGQPGGGPLRQRVLGLAWFAGFPVLAVFAASLLMDRSAFVPRYLVVVAPAWWLLLGLAVTRVGGLLRTSGALVLAAGAWCAFTASAGVLRQLRGGEKIAWDRIAAAVARDAGPAGGTVYAMEGFTALPMAWYAQTDGARLTVRTVTPGTALAVPAWLVVRSGSGAAAALTAAPLLPAGGRMVAIVSEKVADQAVIAFRLSGR